MWGASLLTPSPSSHRPQDVKTVRWHPQGEVLVSASYDDTLKLWVEEDDEWVCAQTLAGEPTPLAAGVRDRALAADDAWQAYAEGSVVLVMLLAAHPCRSSEASLLHLLCSALNSRRSRGPHLDRVGGGI